MRSVPGPLMAGVAIWCALGLVTVSSPDSAAVRFVVPAHWIWLPTAILAASLVPSWRRHPLTATPALLTTMPWWPVPLPAAALIWTGPLGWLPIGMAAAAAFPSLIALSAAGPDPR